MGSTYVRMTIEWSVPIGQTRSITIALHSLAADVRSAHGCVSCSVSSDIAERGVVRYVEEWQTEEDLRRRINADTFVQIVTLMEDAAYPPRIEFGLAGGTQGLEFAEAVRGERINE